MEGTTIEVCGVPDSLPPDRIVDKLTIHFLRPRHGGGEVLKVIYPTSTKGQAFVVFELGEVAAQVAHLKQTLDMGLSEQFPLKVKIIDRSEVDLPVQAMLDLSMFPDQSEVHHLLKKHNFKVTQASSSPGKTVLLEGTFLSLRAVRAQLQKQLQEPLRHHTGHHANGDRPLSPLDGIVSGALPEHSSRTLPHLNGSHGYMSERPFNSSQDHLSPSSLSVSRSPTGLDSSSSNSEQSLSSYYLSRDGRSSRNPSYFLQDSGAPQSLPIFPSDNLTTKPPLQRETSSTRETTLVVDTDVFCYTWSFRKDYADTILKKYAIECRTDGNSEVKNLTLKGRECERAKQELGGLFESVSLSLCTQEIPLSGLSHPMRSQIAKQIQKYKDIFKVIVRQTEKSIVIIGSSSESYEMKQRVLGEPVGLPASGRTGRDTERGPRTRRSSSLPKQQKLRYDQDSRTRLDSAGPQTYSPSHYQDSKHHEEAAMARSRSRTSSESRERTVAQRPVPNAQQEPMSPSRGRQLPLMKKPLHFLERNAASLKSKFTKQK
ncbi:hypothetical protein AALO_G00256920 [Alosa alosa]|uniref:NID domain-containing protein n=1 Tax=Alosa alosa TaxID=278164 RepID=A0AAV6FP87_9TELE|nr:uncharacterized protein si:dkey-154b15.1 [Alosa alosa]XP_048085788.1 uncharacterized protein si:dkey-154b15.1 [Alosa alosa]XP_048085789.1 uncharacterized protein si:dkey-154b15.1 [Alosa alosa]XP_048085790.1 uncharacterized protein si:dkey-154b15.1 [Alosa alosa]XP_048085791.1 uncharacterized protein si:dkey-154b15.1 [Alosa alosa]KAG5264688.1 hypothetical protein AALO_G00256920 [Alosa alosa]